MSYDESVTLANGTEVPMEEWNPTVTVDGETIPLHELRALIRGTTKFLYDVQEVRVGAGQRFMQATQGIDIDLNPDQIEFMSDWEDELEQLEKASVKQLETFCSAHPMYDWMVAQTGISTKTAAVLLSEIQIEKAPHVSSLWRYAGYGVVDGEAEQPSKGEKLHYNKWLKTKLYSMGENFIRAKSGWATFYYDYKERKESQMVDECMACDGSGTFKGEDCYHCEGTGGPAPWGASDEHRHMAAMRYMVKEFLKELWVHWRETMGLEVKNTYAEEYLDREHTDKPSDPDVPEVPEVEEDTDEESLIPYDEA